MATASASESKQLDGRLRKVEFRSSLALGQLDVALEISPRLTVLVGRNGAGKSALLETLLYCAQTATGTLRSSGAVSALATLDVWQNLPDDFACDFEIAGEPFRYGFGQKLEWERDDDTGTEQNPYLAWHEKCERLSPSKLLWDVREGVGRVGKSEMALQPGTGLLAINNLPASFGFPREGAWLAELFRSTRRVQAGVPRTGPRDAHVVFRDKGATHWPFPGEQRVATIASIVLNWYERDRATFDEFEAIGARLGVWTKLRVEVTPVAFGPKEREAGSIEVDDVDIGQVSDGTLRVAEILRLLLSPSKLLLIEEPETSVHPGLLRRLLAEISTYSTDRQTIISTHSPQVVSSADPSEVRLLHRDPAGTHVAGLTKTQVARIGGYLADEGTLGDFIFSGATED